MSIAQTSVQSFKNFISSAQTFERADQRLVSSDIANSQIIKNQADDRERQRQLNAHAASRNVILNRNDGKDKQRIETDHEQSVEHAQTDLQDTFTKKKNRYQGDQGNDGCKDEQTLRRIEQL